MKSYITGQMDSKGGAEEESGKTVGLCLQELS